MGTRGAVVLVHNGREMVGYNHFDSYCSGLGVTVISELREILATDGLAEAALPGLRTPGEMDPVTDGDRELARAWKLDTENVGSAPGVDYYSVFRQLQGHVLLPLQMGLFVTGSSAWPHDSLFCEYAYVLDFDARVLEVYRGFQTDHGAVRGRWAGSGDPTAEYAPVSLAASYPFDRLPSDPAAAMEALETALDAVDVEA
jgi:hypothetical protein